MEETKPKSLKIVSIVVIVLSSLMILSNGVFSLFVHFIGGVKELVGTNSTTQYSAEYAFVSNFLKLSLLTLLFGVLFLIGGVLLIKINRWSRVFLTTIAIIFSIALILMSINLVLIDLRGGSTPIIIISVTYAELVMIVQSLVLLIYLNRKQIKKYFV